MTETPMAESTESGDSPAAPEAARFLGSSVKTLALLDTAVGSTNLGDHIIMDAVNRQIAELFPSCMVFAIASHERMGRRSRFLIRRSAWTISGGTSLLSSHMWFRPSWNVHLLDAFVRCEVILLGAGWHQYQHAPDPYSRWILRRLLSHTHVHSVRDGYTLRMLRSIGITNVVNTGCPTIWQLTPAHCARLPRRKADAVLATVNSYRGLQDPAADRRLLEILKRRYATVYLWIQTHTDYEYAKSLHSDLVYISPSVKALDTLLASGIELDYIGNRLHAGIRALQHGRRAILVAIDNRAREMGRDFGLPTVSRGDFAALEHMLGGHLEISVKPPCAAIERWRAQFNHRRGVSDDSERQVIGE